jgi:hypothetical protein
MKSNDWPVRIMASTAMLALALSQSMAQPANQRLEDMLDDDLPNFLGRS